MSRRLRTIHPRSARRARLGGTPRWPVAAALGVVACAVGVGAAFAAPGGGPAAAPTLSCPTVADKLPAVPDQARAEVERNLALLNTQIAEANRRLVTSQGEGGPNFVQNAIVGPLLDKRVATINRIATAIGRHAARPQGLDALAGCRLAP